MRSSVRRASGLGIAALALLGPSATAAVADDATPSTLPLAVTTVRELADPVTGFQAAQDAQGAYRGDVTIFFHADLPEGQQLLPYKATVTYPTRDGGYGSWPAYVNGTTGYATLDTRSMADGDTTLTLTAFEGTDVTSSDSTPVTGTLTLRTANPSAAFTSPTRSSVVWGPVTWNVDAAPAAGGAAIDRVEFYAGGYHKKAIPAYVDTTAPYSYPVDFNTPSASREMQAVAVDEDGYRSAVAGRAVVVEPGPTVTAEGTRLLDAEGAQYLHVEWSSAVANGLNFDPNGYNATTWLTQAVIAVDGRVLETDDLDTLTWLCPRKAYHCLSSIPWSNGYDLTDLGVGSHTVTVTVTDNHGAVGKASFTTVVGRDKLTVSIPGRSVLAGNLVSIDGHLTGATGATIPGSRIAVQARLAGSSTWTTLTTRTLTSDFIDVALVPRQNESLRVVELTGTKQVSAPMAVTVQPKLTAKASATSVRRGATVKITGQVAGKSPGAVVRLQVSRNGKWVTLATARQSSTGTVAFSVPERTGGTFYYRLYSPATTAFLAGNSPSVTVHVR
ncbi:Ig-like domain-containing protein [Streptomyces sp. NPDC001156]